MNTKLFLASTSRYRAELLARLHLPFEAVAPGTDEAQLPGEQASALAERLSISKARDAAQKIVAREGLGANGLVIGSDQVAALADQRLGKPGSIENARAQLIAMRAQTVVFHTGLAVYDIAAQSVRSTVVDTVVQMRDYSAEEVDRYLALENALDCAGSAKSEGLGVALMASMRSDDPTALVGLPLIALCALLREHRVSPLA